MKYLTKLPIAIPAASIAPLCLHFVNTIIISLIACEVVSLEYIQLPILLAISQDTLTKNIIC